MMELEVSAKNMETIAQKNRLLMAENEELKQEPVTRQGGLTLISTELKYKQVESGHEESLPTQDEKGTKETQVNTFHQQPQKQMVHRENLETCQIELNDLKGKLQDSDKTLQLNLDKDKNKDEYAKEYEDEIARLQKEKEMLSKNLKDDLDKKNGELDTLRFEMNKENAELKKQLEKCMGDCDNYRKELTSLKEKQNVFSSQKYEVQIDITKSEPLPSVKEEKHQKKPKQEKEKKKKQSKQKLDDAPISKTEIDNDKTPKKTEVVVKSQTESPSRVEAKPQIRPRSKLEENIPEREKKVEGDGGVCRCMEHPMVKIIYKILYGGTEVLTTEEIVYLHIKLCVQCRTALGPPRDEAQIRARRRMLQQQIMARQEEVSKGVAQLEESVHEGKLYLERLFKHFAAKSKAKENGSEQTKMAPSNQAVYSACMMSDTRRTASGTAIGSKNQQWREFCNKLVVPTGAPKLTVR